MPDDPVIALLGMAPRDLIEALAASAITFAEYVAMVEWMESAFARAIAARHEQGGDA